MAIDAAGWGSTDLADSRTCSFVEDRVSVLLDVTREGSAIGFRDAAPGTFCSLKMDSARFAWRYSRRMRVSRHGRFNVRPFFEESSCGRDLGWRGFV